MRFILSVYLPAMMLAACTNGNSSRGPSSLSKMQNRLENLADSFRIDYVSVQTPREKDLILTKYNDRIHSLLLNRVMDHFKVHVDSLTIDHLTVTTRFRSSQHVAIRSSITFKAPMPPKEDSLFNFMKNIKPGVDVAIDFAYIGQSVLNTSDSSLPTLLIFAFPVSYQMHHLH